MARPVSHIVDRGGGQADVTSALRVASSVKDKIFLPLAEGEGIHAGGGIELRRAGRQNRVSRVTLPVVN